MKFVEDDDDNIQWFIMHITKVSEPLEYERQKQQSRNLPSNCHLHELVVSPLLPASSVRVVSQD